MGRRVPNRMELRSQAEAADVAKKREPTSKKRTAQSKRASKVVRLKAYWGVFDHTLKQVALFEYRQREDADNRAGELAAKKNKPHVVQLVKEKMED